jgi:hypothetical protein
MNIERVLETISDLDTYAVFADHTGNRQLSRAMRQAAVLLREMVAEHEAAVKPMVAEYEAAAKPVAKLSIVSTADFDKWQENPSP